MNLRFMQIIDYWVGIPLCFLLSLWELVFGKIFSSKEEFPRKILFIELSEMGTVVLSYSALKQANKQFENVERYFLIFESNAESVRLLDEIPPQNILTIRNNNFLDFTVSALVTLRRIRALKIDTVIDMELFSRFSAIFSYLTGAANRVGFYQYTGEGLYRGEILTHRVTYSPNQHISLNLLSLLFSLKAPRDEVPLLKESVLDKLIPLPSHKVTSAEKTEILELLRNNNPSITSQSPLIVINGYPGKLLSIRGWSIDRYGDLVKKLLENQEIFVVLIGLRAAEKFNEQIASRAANDRCVDLTGQTASLRELVNLLSLARVLLTNDGGPAHFASLTDVHTVVLFGPGGPTEYSPIGNALTVLDSHFSCSPCLTAQNHRYTLCSDNKCLQAISVEQVLSAVTSAYQSAS